MDDSVAVGLALGLVADVESHLLPVSVVTQDGPALGQTLVDRRPLASRLYSPEGLARLLDLLSADSRDRDLVQQMYTPPEAHTRVMMRVDGEAFLNELVERIASFRVA